MRTAALIAFRLALICLLLAISAFISAIGLGALDVRTSHFAEKSKFTIGERRDDSNLSELYNITGVDGLDIDVKGPTDDFVVECRKALPGRAPRKSSEPEIVDPDWAKLKCNVRSKGGWLFLQIIFGSEEKNSETRFRQCNDTKNYYMTTRIWPFSRIESIKDEKAFEHLKDFSLTASEKRDEKMLIGSVKPLCLIGFEVTSDLNFVLEEPSIKAVIEDRFTRALGIADIEVDPTTRERISTELVGTLSYQSGFFDVRRLVDSTGNSMPGIRILLSGTFEYLILSLGVLALLASPIAALGVSLPQSYEFGRAFGRLSSSIGGILTYLGLLGTLFGVFAAVNELSSIDFLNEFKKVFEQTASFGAMSIAIGTSVVGLGMAVVVGLVQAILKGMLKIDPFDG